MKPENVLVSPYGEPCLSDFGLARLQGDPQSRSAVVTASVAHAAPEALAGQSPSESADVYSVASTVFELLSGRPAFVRDSDETMLPVLARIASAPVPDLRPKGVPDAVCRAVEQAMAKDPEQRPASAGQLGEALQHAHAVPVVTSPLRYGQGRTAVIDPPPPPGGFKPPRTPRGAPRRGVIAVAAAGALLTAVALAVVANRVLHSEDRAPTATASNVRQANAAPKAGSKDSAAPNVPTGPGDVAGQPAGLFCHDLQTRGYSYAAAVDYWRLHGQPDQMDADRNGIPCETVFARADVASYWGVQGARPASGGLPHGLSCQALVSRGASYAAAVAYWYAEGAPDRMDADHNDIPCETVYAASVVDQFWHG